MLRAHAFFCVVSLGLMSSLPANATYHAAGSFCSVCFTASPENQLFDDGLHQDGAAGDGLFGGDVVVDQAAGHYFWFVGSTPIIGWPSFSWPQCGCGALSVGDARLWTTGPGDVIHFTLDTRPSSWLPLGYSVATDHESQTPSPYTVGIDFDFGDPRYYPPRITSPMTQTGSIWEAIVLVPLAGIHRYAFYSDGVLFTLTYSANCGSCYLGEQPTGQFTTSLPDSYVRLQFDEALGRMRAEVLGLTPARNRSWASIKALYR